jgi:hypothetical protein
MVKINYTWSVVKLLDGCKLANFICGVHGYKGGSAKIPFEL